MLAAQLVKEFASEAVPVNELENRTVLQFWNPLARTNAPGCYPRQSDCSKCQPKAIAAAKWRERYQEFVDTLANRSGLKPISK